MATLPTRPTTPALDAVMARAKPITPSVAPKKGRGRLVFALDATMSRQPTWDLACNVQAQMFQAADEIGGLAVQLIYFRGLDECKASRWVNAPSALTNLMTKIDCRGGHTQIGRVLRHTVREAETDGGVAALVYVGDAMEEPVDALCAAAGEVGRLGAKCFMFHEGDEHDRGKHLQGDRAPDRRRLCPLQRERARRACVAPARRGRLRKRRNFRAWPAGRARSTGRQASRVDEASKDPSVIEAAWAPGGNQQEIGAIEQD